ncbi:hypothetical protein [Pararhizobium sp.]|uniref:hypothetical protein n=1 Tax=Pararhizobium sp. TaxID=1977563 RepID=UPI003D14FC60
MLTNMESAAADDIEAALRADPIPPIPPAKPERQAVIEQMTNTIMQNRSNNLPTTREDLEREGFTSEELKDLFPSASKAARARIDQIEARGTIRKRVPANSSPSARSVFSSLRT